MKNLIDPKEITRAFLDILPWLEDKMGPVLFQLPPQWHLNLERLEEFLEVLPCQYLYAIELRHPTWYCEEVFSLLRNKNIALCFHDFSGEFKSPKKTSEDFVYVRFHGPHGKYRGKYSEMFLRKQVSHIKEWVKEGREVFVFFNNDAYAHAIKNALGLQKYVDNI